MAKITKIISPEDENKEYQKSEITTDGIKHTIVRNEENELSQNTNSNDEIETNSFSDSEMAEWLISFFGERLFLAVKDNPNIRLPYLEEQLATGEWLIKALKTIFTLEDFEYLLNRVYEKSNTIERLQESSNYKNESSKLKTENQQIEEELNKVRIKKNKLEKEIKNALPANRILEIVFKSTINTDKIKNALVNIIDSGEEASQLFLLAFIDGWVQMTLALKENTQNESEKLEQIQSAGRQFLAALSGCYIPERRELLDNIAEYLSSNIENYIIISPEQSLQLDPGIHNAKGLGGTRVKEGISFAVLRKDNKQTYQYADIIVQ